MGARINAKEFSAWLSRMPKNQPRIAATKKTGAGRTNMPKSATKAEETALERLKQECEGMDALICAQVRNLFPLAGGGTYIPDFVVLSPHGARVVEVKGGYRGPGWEQGRERYKRAAAQYSGKAGVAFEIWEVKGKAINIQQWEE